jgi:hypothetical protein
VTAFDNNKNNIEKINIVFRDSNLLIRNMHYKRHIVLEHSYAITKNIIYINILRYPQLFI